MYGAPADARRASALAMRDAARSRELWRQHAIARRLTDRVRLADLARFYEDQVVQTAVYLISLGEPTK